jgi:hypothetical protein
MLHHVEREKEKLTTLSSIKRVDEFIHSIKFKVTYSIKYSIKQLYLIVKKNKKK